MAFNIHKPGQGYWVRVFTATLAASLVLATCAWLWPQVQQIDLPTSAWNVRLAGVEGAPPAPGASVSLVSIAEADGAATEVGTANVKSSAAAGAGRAEVRLNRVKLNPGKVSSQVQGLRVGAAGTEGAVLRTSGAVTPVPLFETLYLQAAVVLVVIIAGVWLIYWVVGVNRRTSEFLIATDGEMRKVNWSTRRDVIASTYVVIGASVLIATGLFLVDTVFAKFFSLIGVLD